MASTIKEMQAYIDSIPDDGSDFYTAILEAIRKEKLKALGVEFPPTKTEVVKALRVLELAFKDERLMRDLLGDMFPENL